ncbi:hypothetical protein CHL76_02415 [Marinococcus halophilus]|uniref:Uncharacterized protein n=1 Tax=Marinococcus halophilus TaxID=1371 RepID=A0A510Y1I0_MARHA|nr:hypothetical protein [Marinococcus halophilus]OZT81229.1 hypothetical protein CHL76_02415 [Marinococcus halophilus]GEK57168.1 hypothetical protein MHA01_00730 [Marinococcus halophilus]
MNNSKRIEILEEKVDKAEAVIVDAKELIQDIKEEEVKRQLYAEGKVSKKSIGLRELYEPSNNEKRNQAIKKAKEIQSRGFIGIIPKEVQYIVDEEKRTVVALIRVEETKHIIARGIAKTDPNDVFNADIGKAIALKRAKDLEVDDDLLFAPNPDEAEVGDVVQLNLKYTTNKKRVTLTERLPKKDNVYGTGKAFLTTVNNGYVNESQFTILNDSHKGAE